MKHVAIFIALLYFQMSTFAVEIDKLNAGEKLTTGDVTFGDKTIRLPSGDWFLAGKYKSHVTRTQSVNNEIYQAYFANIAPQQFQSGLMFQTNMGSTGGTGWTMDVPCTKPQNELYKNEFSGSIKHPECLLIHKRVTHLNSPASGNLFPQVQEWMRQNNVTPKGAFYEIYYQVQLPGNYGVARLFISTKNVPSEALLIEYANEFANRLRGVLTQREKMTTIPELPGSR